VHNCPPIHKKSGRHRQRHHTPLNVVECKGVWRPTHAHPRGRGPAEGLRATLHTHTLQCVCVCVCERESMSVCCWRRCVLKCHTKAHWRRRLRAEATSSDEKSTYGRTFIMRFGIGLLQNGQAAVDLNSVLPSCPSFLLLLLLLRRFPASAAVRHTGLSLVRSQRSFWCCLNLSP